MKLFVISDLHLEHGTIWKPRKKDLTADVIILAGDIHEGAQAFNWIDKTFPGKPVIYIAGNHEFYNNQHPGLRIQLNWEAHKHPNIHYLDDSSVEIGGVLFIGATLWTDYKLFHTQPYSMYMCNNKIADHDVIHMDHKRFLAQDALELHEASVKHIEEELLRVRNTDSPEKQKTVVITHHCPSHMSVPEMYKMDDITPGFSSDLSSLIFKYEPTLWVHGHTHTQFDYELGATRVVCNPHGYPRYVTKAKHGVMIKV